MSHLPPRITAVPTLRATLQPFSAVVVTGGSSGIGKSFIGLIRSLRPDLPVGNLSRRDPQDFFRVEGSGKWEHFPCDLSDPAAVATSAEAVRRFLAGLPPGPVLLINNSGFGAFGCFPVDGLTRELGMIDVNVRALVQLTGLLLPDLRARGGVVLNVASVVAFLPTPYAATYGATKAFVLHWTLALDEELRGTGLRALAACPGTTRTEFFREAGLGGQTPAERLAMTSDDVARIALGRIAGGGQVVTGWRNAVMTVLASRLPKPWSARLAGLALRRRAKGQP